MELISLSFFSIIIPLTVCLFRIWRGGTYQFVIPYFLVCIFQSGYFLISSEAIGYGILFVFIVACLLFLIYENFGFSRYFVFSKKDEFNNKIFYYFVVVFTFALFIYGFREISMYLDFVYGKIISCILLFFIALVFLMHFPLWRR